MMTSGQFLSSAKVSSHSNTRFSTLKLGMLLVYYSLALVEDVQDVVDPSAGFIDLILASLTD